MKRSLEVLEVSGLYDPLVENQTLRVRRFESTPVTAGSRVLPDLRTYGTEELDALLAEGAPTTTPPTPEVADTQPTPPLANADPELDGFFAKLKAFDESTGGKKNNEAVISASAPTTTESVISTVSQSVAQKPARRPVSPRVDATGLSDIVNVDAKGRGHQVGQRVVTSKKTGQNRIAHNLFLSNHEMGLIEYHQDLIRQGAKYVSDAERLAYITELRGRSAAHPKSANSSVAGPANPQTKPAAAQVRKASPQPTAEIKPADAQPDGQPEKRQPRIRNWLGHLVVKMSGVVKARGDSSHEQPPLATGIPEKTTDRRAAKHHLGRAAVAVTTTIILASGLLIKGGGASAEQRQPSPRLSRQAAAMVINASAPTATVTAPEVAPILTVPTETTTATTTTTFNHSPAAVERPATTTTATVTATVHAAPTVAPAIAAAKPATKASPSKSNITSAPVVASGCDIYAPLLEKKQYNWSVPTIMAICDAESGGRPDAVPPIADSDGLFDDGLLQIHNGETIYGKQIFDPAFNISIGFQKYKVQGFRAWTTYKNGTYLQYLPEVEAYLKAKGLKLAA